MNKNKGLLIISLFVLLFSCKKKEVPQPPVNPCFFNGIDTCNRGGGGNTSPVRAVTIDINDNKQSMHSFGASDCWMIKFVGKNWPLSKRNEIADLLFSKDFDANGNPKGLGLSMWRINLGAGSFEQGTASNIASEWRREECYQNANGTYDWNKQAGNRWFAQAAKARGVDNLLMFNIAPPVHYSRNGLATGNIADNPNRLNLKADKYDEFADFLTECAKNYSQNGLPINFISPINEPQYDWAPAAGTQASQEGTGALNSECLQVVQELNTSITAKGLNTKIAFGEAGSHNYVYSTAGGNRGNVMDYFWRPSSAGYIGNLANVEKMVSAHSYFAQPDLAKLISNRLSMASTLPAINPAVKFWQTEYCVLNNEDGTQGNGRDLGINSALYIARVIHQDLALANATSWQWWLGVSAGDYKDGLVYITDINGNMGALPATKSDGLIYKSKMLWALGNYSRFIRPGMVRVNTTTAGFTDPSQAALGLMVSSYKNPTTKELVTVVINYSNNDEKLKLGGVTYSTPNVKTYTTSSLKELESGTTSATADISIGARSIVTIVGTYQ